MKPLTHVWRWRKTKYGPLCDELSPTRQRVQGRFGERCRIVARGWNGSVGVEFEDGYRVVAPFRAVRRAS